MLTGSRAGAGDDGLAGRARKFVELLSASGTRALARTSRTGRTLMAGLAGEGYSRLEAVLGQSGAGESAVFWSWVCEHALDLFEGLEWGLFTRIVDRYLKHLPAQASLSPRLEALRYVVGCEGSARPPKGVLLDFVTKLQALDWLETVFRDACRAHLIEAIPLFVEAMMELWDGEQGSWWEHGPLERLVKLLCATSKARPDIPVGVFYAADQEALMRIQESLVLMRGNAESREMARFIHLFYSLESKAKLIELENSIQMRHELQDAFFRTLFEGLQSTTLGLTIRRDNIVRDAFAQIETKKPYELRRHLRVKFQDEDGVDEGGVQKEFFQLLLRACFNPAYGVFKYYEESRLFWFQPMADDRLNQEAAEDCYAIGKLFGLAIYNSVLLDSKFPLVLYKMLVDAAIGLEDLAELDRPLARGLEAILLMDRAAFDESGLEGSAFEIEVGSGAYASGKPLRFHLPTTQRGLTYENRGEFVQLYAEAVLHRTVELQLQAFVRGFKYVFGKSIIFQYRPCEIEALLCGSQTYNYGALQEKTTYDGGYSARSPVVRWFWEIFHGRMSEKQRHRLLAFVTGTDRAPVGGLANLGMRIVKNGPDADRLPTAHTCFNILLLNQYSSKERLAYWLLLAIENCAGFGLQ